MSAATDRRRTARRRRTRPPRRSSPTATCSSPSPTRCSARPPTPRTSCRRPGCGGSGVDLDTVRDQRAYLVRITTRQALSRLRTLGRRKESYVGPWLPEPLLTAPDVAEDVELADSVSMAMLLVLETLTPTERAVFVLREVFDLGYDEIAEAVDKTPAAVRQIAHRARAHVAARRPRGVVSAAETRHALEAFQRAVETGDLQGLLDILAPDVVAARRRRRGQAGRAAPVVGAEQGRPPAGRRAGAGSARADRRPSGAGQRRTRRCSSGSTGRSTPSWRCASTTAWSAGLYAVRNPEKLSHMAAGDRAAADEPSSAGRRTCAGNHNPTKVGRGHAAHFFVIHQTAPSPARRCAVCRGMEP